MVLNPRNKFNDKLTPHKRLTSIRVRLDTGRPVYSYLGSAEPRWTGLNQIIADAVRDQLAIGECGEVYTTNSTYWVYREC